MDYLANAPCSDRGTERWCTNGWGDFTCEWSSRRSRCKEVKSSSDCSDNGWRDCQGASECVWESSNGRGRGRCVRNAVDCDGLGWKDCQGEAECRWKSSNGRGRGRCESNSRDSCGGKSERECNDLKRKDNSCRWSNRDDECKSNHFFESEDSTDNYYAQE